MKRHHHGLGISAPVQKLVNQHKFAYFALGISVVVGLSSATPWPPPSTARAFSSGLANELGPVAPLGAKPVTAPESGKPLFSVAGALSSDPLNPPMADYVQQHAGSGTDAHAFSHQSVGAVAAGSPPHSGLASTARLNPSLSLFQLMHPVATRTISSPYGWRGNPTGPGRQIHIGQDYPIACGTPVRASEDGEVVVSSWAGHSGNRVTIDHGNRIMTGYSHNSLILVRVGQKVSQGQIIARAGTTGNSTGCHVHFEVIVNGQWQNPSHYLVLGPGQIASMFVSESQPVTASRFLMGHQTATQSGSSARATGQSSGSSASHGQRKATKKTVQTQQATGVKPKPHKSKTVDGKKTKPQAPKVVQPPRSEPTKRIEKPRPSRSPQVTPTRTSSPSASPSATRTPAPTASPTSTSTPSPTQISQAPDPTAAPTSSAPELSVSPSPTATPSAPAEPTSSASASPEAMLIPDPSQKPGPTAVPTATAQPSASTAAPEPAPSSSASIASQKPKESTPVIQEPGKAPASTVPVKPKNIAKAPTRTTTLTIQPKNLKKATATSSPRPVTAQAAPAPVPVKKKAIQPVTASQPNRPVAKVGKPASPAPVPPRKQEAAATPAKDKIVKKPKVPASIEPHGSAANLKTREVNP